MQTTYRCSNDRCKAVDHDNSPSNSVPPIVLNCWRCGAGRGLSLQEMQTRQIGMFPLLPGEN